MPRVSSRGIRYLNSSIVYSSISDIQVDFAQPAYPSFSILSWRYLTPFTYRPVFVRSAVAGLASGFAGNSGQHEFPHLERGDRESPSSQYRISLNKLTSSDSFESPPRMDSLNLAGAHFQDSGRWTRELQRRPQTVRERLGEDAEADIRGMFEHLKRQT